MSKTYATRVFDNFSIEKDAIALRDFTNNDLTLINRRTLPKRSGTFPGMEKAEVKLTMIDTATGEPIGIVTLSSSIKVGTSDASRDLLRDIVVEVASSADYTNLLNDQRLFQG